LETSINSGANFFSSGIYGHWPILAGKACFRGMIRKPENLPVKKQKKLTLWIKSASGQPFFTNWHGLIEFQDKKGKSWIEFSIQDFPFFVSIFWFKKVIFKSIYY
jgi:hypothetical protein